jgi:hypothetical protein
VDVRGAQSALHNTGPMKRIHTFSLGAILAASVLAGAAACAPGDGDDVGSAEQANTEDLALAKSIVDLLGGPEGKCKSCHAVTAGKIRDWGNALSAIEAACFTPENLTDAQRVNCLRTNPSDPTSSFRAHKLGLYATAARHQSFEDLFEGAFPAETWSAEYATFTQRVSMPRGGGQPLTPAQFARVKKWVLRGMPQLDQAFGGGDAGADASASPECVPSTTPALAGHLAAMKTAGWGARLADEATPMFDCGSATNPLSCLASRPDETATFGAPGIAQKLRGLYAQPLSSHYWVRSSADGRYVGFGMNDSAKIVDLGKPVTAPAIAVDADYDPLFLPSNDGFAFAGSSDDDSIRVCRQSLLADVANAAAPSISLTEAKCARIGNKVYQSIGSALEGGRYFVTWGAHTNDDGGHAITTQLPANFGAMAKTTFTPMVNDGQSYLAQAPVVVTLPNEGDMMLSPSSLLAATRFGDATKSKGYRIRFIKSAQQGGDAGLSIQTPLAAEICLPGQKIGFSFDERFVVTHQYVDLSDAEQAAAGLAAGSSNIVLVDLATGKQVRLTKSGAGQFALYPHFRADGWLYFIVRDMNTSTESVIASDAAIRMSTP